MEFGVTDRSGCRGAGFYYRQKVAAERKFSGIAEESFQALKDPDERSRHHRSEDISRKELFEKMRYRSESDGESQADGASGSVNPNQEADGADQATDNLRQTVQDGKDWQEETDAKTETEVVVRPDGSRVLMVTMQVGGMATSMSIKLSEPTDLPNGTRDTILSQYLKNQESQETVRDSGIDTENA